MEKNSKKKRDYSNAFFNKPIVRYSLRRIFNSCITLFFIVTAVFLLLRMVPKERYINFDKLGKIPPSQRELYIQKTYEKYGLNDPIHVQLGKFYYQLIPIPKDICVRDRYEQVEGQTEWDIVCTKSETKIVYLGESITYKYGMDIADEVIKRFPISFKIGIISMIVTYIFAFPLGILQAMYKDKFFDRAGNIFIVVMIAVPALVFYYYWYFMGAKLFGTGMFDKDDFFTWLIPIFAMAFVSVGGIMIWVRRFMVDQLHSDYVKFARSKGLSEKRIMFVHVFRNAVVPLIRTLPFAIIFTLQGSYFVETLFNIPGSGLLLVSGMRKFDNPLVQAMVLVYAIMFMIAILLGDLLTVMVDPRISLTKNK